MRFRWLLIVLLFATALLITELLYGGSGHIDLSRMR